MNRKLFALLVLTGGPSVPLSAVIVFQGQSGIVVPANAQVSGAQPVAVGPDGQPIASGAKPVDSPRLQKLRQLQFDRRPSTILKAWATPEKPKEEPKAVDVKNGDAKDKPGDAAQEKKETEGKGEDAKKDAPPKDTEATENNADAPEVKKEEETQGKSEQDKADASDGVDKVAEEKPQGDTEKVAAEKKAAEEKAKEAARKAAEEKAKAEALDAELKSFERNVTLGKWEEVKTYLAGLPEEERQPAYQHLISSLQVNQAAQQARAAVQNMPQIAQFIETNFFTTEDILSLIDASPTDIDNQAYPSLAALVLQSLSSGNAIDRLVTRFKEESTKEDGKVTRREAAKILMLARQSVVAGAFLPSIVQATTDKDREGLELLAKHLLALYAKDGRYDDMESAWSVTQSLLAIDGLEDAERQEGMKRAIELAPKLQDDIGIAWLKGSFTTEPKRGVEILSALGARAAQAIVSSPTNPGSRLEGLRLQKIAVEAFIETTPDKAAAMRPEITLFASNWAREAKFTYQQAQASFMGPQIQRDMYGNFFYMNEDQMMNRMRQGNQPMPISTGEILEVMPNDAWFKLVDDGARPELQTQIAQLYLKGGEEAKAFPYIEELAKSSPDRAKALVREFLEVWTTNHDPNASRRRTNPYMYFFGFERRAESIPLTRSKQQRNLEELSEFVRRLRALPIGELDEELLASAFTTCHSSAEVYRLEAIREVFGSFEQLKPKTLSGLAEKMRENLAGLWRQPAEQQKNQTKRKARDIQGEVMRGYKVAGAVIDDGLSKFRDSWELQLIKAAIDHDELNYRQDLEKRSDFTKKREQSLEAFQTAAATYTSHVAGMKEDERSTRVFDQWFYAGLGACDLASIDREKVADPKQPTLIRQAILALPKDIAEWHMDKFANALFTRMGSVNPAVKFTYLEAGFEIVGDHKLAWEARKVFDYYKDLVTEIKLEAVVDGQDIIGEKPFGVFVNLRHTREIERESGGFGRYLQNQNSMTWAYNYGRPTEDYRDKFQAAVEQALNESFEVLSVTFQSENVTSRATEEYGWRTTPYAYLLLKARGPQIDRVPPLRIDLDFLDTSGYVVIPVKSAALPVDASQHASEMRPVTKLEVVQTLDERQASDGKLVLEVKATGVGLVPDLEELVTVAPNEFDIAKIDDQGLTVSRFDPDGDENAVISERTWLITLKAREGLAERPKEFHFATAELKDAKMTFQRYDDADLVSAEAVLPLEEQYGDPSRAWMWIAAVGVMVVIGGSLFGIRLLRRPKPVSTDAFAMPEELTPFTVMGLLQRIGARDGLSESQHAELRASLGQLERHYFADDGEAVPDLRSLAESWIGRARKG